MYLNESIKTPFVSRFPKLILPHHVIIFVVLLVGIYFGFNKYKNIESEDNQTLAIVSSPKINDIYFLDYRVMSSDLRPKHNYRIGKVVDITGDIVTLVYSNLFYQHHHSAIKSIQYGQLSYKKFFEPKRYDLSFSTIKNMHEDGAIYLAKRPVRDRLYGNVVSPYQRKESSSLFVFGKKENAKGEAFLKEVYSETNLASAYEQFQISANYGFAKGQVNLAEMYINGHHVKKDFIQALFWLKEASFQSNKSAILKYGIICKQVKSCNLIDFYQELTEAGVSIKVRELDFKLSD